MKYGSAVLTKGHAALATRYPGVPLGDGAVLRRGRIHEVTGAAADMFAVLAAVQYGADCIWIGLRRDTETLCPAGLQPHINPSKIIVAEGVSRGELLWAAEQALRADGAFAIILDMPDTLSLRESRRLQLAAEEGGGIGLICLRGVPNSSAAQTRWTCAALSAERPTWRWQCVKGKNGEIGAWTASSAGGGYGEDTLHLAPAIAA